MSEQIPEYDAERDRAERWRGVWQWLCWLVIGPLLLVAAARLVAHDATLELIALNAVSQWLYLPAWLVLPLASYQRRWPLAVAAALLVGAHVLWVDPRGLVAAELPKLPAGAVRFRVMSANLLGVNEHTEGIAGEVLRARPDVLLVQELAPHWLERFAAADMLAALPYRSAVARTDSFGIGVYSRTPLLAQQLELSELPAFSADVQLGTTTLRIFNFHTLPPRRRDYVPVWNDMMQSIESLLRERRGPVLLGGDLNATPHHAWFQRLLATGLRSAHEERGRALASTWPNGLMPAPPIRLDHLLFSPELVVLAIEEGEGAGSDHRPVIGDFALLP